MCARMKKPPKEELELVEMKSFIQGIDINLAAIKNENDKTQLMLQILFNYQAKLEAEDI